MIDPKLLRSSPKYVAEQLVKKKFFFDYEAYEKLEEKRKGLQIKVQTMQEEKNKITKAITRAKHAKK